MTSRTGISESVVDEHPASFTGLPRRQAGTVGDENPMPASAAPAEDAPARTESFRDSAVVVLLTALLALIFLIPTRLVFPPLGAAGAPVVIAGVGLLIVWVLASVVERGHPRGFQAIRWVLLAYLATQIAAYAVGYHRGLPEIESKSADRWMIATVSMVGVVFCFADGPRSRRQLNRLLGTLVGFGVFSAMVGAAQFFVGFDLQPHVRIPGLRPNSALLEATERGTGGVARVSGMTSHYIEFGVVLAVLLPIAIHFALFERDPRRRFIWWGSVVALASAVPLSVSRSGIVALGVTLLTLAAVWSWRLRYNALIWGSIALVLFRAVTPGVLGTLRALFANHDQDPSVQGRTEDYDVVFPMIYDSPLAGRGAGTFMPERYILLDNQILLTLVSSGIVGLIGLLGLFIGGMGMARSIRRRAKAAEDRHLGQALFASIAGCLVASLTFDSLSFVQFTGVLAIILGSVGALWRLSGTSASDPCIASTEPNGRVLPPLWPDVKWVRR